MIIEGKEKAHLVAQDFSQCSEDYSTTYTPVAKLTTIRIILALAARYDYELVMYNVKMAFLHAPLDCIIYCKLIPGFPVPLTGDGIPADALQVFRAIYIWSTAIIP